MGDARQLLLLVPLLSGVVACPPHERFVDGGVVETDAGVITSLTLSAPYTINPGAETYECFRMTVHLAGTIYMSNFTPMEVNGTHHVVLYLDASPTQADGASPCVGTFTGLGQTLLYAAGRGAGALLLPAGVGFPLRDGEQLIFQVHEFNATPATISDTATLQIGFLPPATNVTQAQVVLVGNNQFTVPPNASAYSVPGQCTKIPPGSQVFAVFPHMHQIGSSITATLDTPGGTQSLFDVNPWVFSEQPNLFFSPPLSVASSGRESVTCVYDNASAQPVKYGPSSTDEMCYAITYLYPAAASLPAICMN